jgi:hypothetical protein
MKYSETNLKSDSNYKEFGKFIINTKMLYQNILSVKYKSNAPIPSIKKIKISNDFVNGIVYIFDTGKIDYEKLRDLTNAENDIFKNLVMKSGLFNILKYNYNETRENIDDVIEDYEVLKGELEAGNNNPDVLEKCRKVIKKLFIYGKISESEYNELTNDL